MRFAATSTVAFSLSIVCSPNSSGCVVVDVGFLGLSGRLALPRRPDLPPLSLASSPRVEAFSFGCS